MKNMAAVCLMILFANYVAVPAKAVPLTLSYTISDAGGGLNHYDFTLTLDNNDGSWAAGNEWDWIVFGDAMSMTSPLADFLFTSFDPIIDPGFSGGFHNGPTLALVNNSAFLPGWQPVSIGDTLTWSGVSATFLSQGNLLWSNLVTGGGASNASFIVATQTVPESSTLLGLATGLTLLSAIAWRRRRAPET